MLILLCLTFNVLYCWGQTDSTIVKEGKKKISFKDPVDGAFDMSSFLLEHKGFLPVPTIITEPAIGYGGGIGLLYFHPSHNQYNEYVPPSISGVLGMATENGTHALGAMHMHVFGKDRVRTFTSIVWPKVHFDYYGNNNVWLNEHPLGVTLSSWLFLQRVQVRIANSKFYVGASYSYFHSDVTFEAHSESSMINEIIKGLNDNSVISTLKPMVLYDSRNNIFTPTKGINAELSLKYNSQWLGASDDYSVWNTFVYGYQPINNRLFSAWRFEGKYLVGEAPFYAYPFVRLRGIPAMRYQSDRSVVAETEWRYNVYKRYSLVAFSGMGKAFPEMEDFNDVDWVYSIGTGFRYEVARLLGIHMGTDFAWGNGKDFAFYIVFGSSW